MKGITMAREWGDQDEVIIVGIDIDFLNLVYLVFKIGFAITLVWLVLVIPITLVISIFSLFTANTGVRFGW